MGAPVQELGVLDSDTVAPQPPASESPPAGGGALPDLQEEQDGSDGEDLTGLLDQPDELETPSLSNPVHVEDSQHPLQHQPTMLDASPDGSSPEILAVRPAIPEPSQPKAGLARLRGFAKDGPSPVTPRFSEEQKAFFLELCKKKLAGFNAPQPRGSNKYMPFRYVYVFIYVCKCVDSF